VAAMSFQNLVPKSAVLLLFTCTGAHCQDLLTVGVIEGSGAEVALGGFIALGANAYAGDSSIAIGENSYANSHSLAIGRDTIAGGMNNVVIGGAATVTTAPGANEGYGSNSVAIGGYRNRAFGEYSYAMGYQSTANGNGAYAHGYVVDAAAFAIALGSFNLGHYGMLTPVSNNDWIENSPLFELGNGKPDYTEASNAITTLKNGQTTLTNKAWKNRNSSVSPTADPSSASTDSGGQALIVEGHTLLKGKVILEAAQGDVSMGIYQ